MKHKLTVLRGHCETARHRLRRDPQDDDLRGVDPLADADGFVALMGEYAALGIELVTLTPHGDDPVAWTERGLRRGAAAACGALTRAARRRAAGRGPDGVRRQTDPTGALAWRRVRLSPAAPPPAPRTRSRRPGPAARPAEPSFESRTVVHGGRRSPSRPRPALPRRRSLPRVHRRRARYRDPERRPSRQSARSARRSRAGWDRQLPGHRAPHLVDAGLRATARTAPSAPGSWWSRTASSTSTRSSGPDGRRSARPRPCAPSGPRYQAAPASRPTQAMITLSTCATPEDHAARQLLVRPVRQPRAPHRQDRTAGAGSARRVVDDISTSREATHGGARGRDGTSGSASPAR